MTTRLLVLEALKARAQAIRTAAGYETDAGLNVHIGRVALSEESDSAAVAGGVISIVPAETEVPAQGRKVQQRLPVTLEGVIKAADPADPWVSAEKLLGDMLKAVFGPADKTLGGLLVDPPGLQRGGTRPVDREPGSVLVGVQLDALTTFVEPVEGPA